MVRIPHYFVYNGLLGCEVWQSLFASVIFLAVFYWFMIISPLIISEEVRLIDESIKDLVPELSKKIVSNGSATDYVIVPLSWDDFVVNEEKIVCEIAVCSIDYKFPAPVGLIITDKHQTRFIYSCDYKTQPLFVTSYIDSIHLSLGGPYSRPGKIDIKINFNCSERIYGEFVVPFDARSLTDKKIATISEIISHNSVWIPSNSLQTWKLGLFLVMVLTPLILLAIYNICEISSKLVSGHYD